ncbi:MAG TPA: cyclodeaminase/cyclohydrolase family protein, partial [Bacteroidales bacterium]|nr:cyclodeaminase/cyclohydrolase family protein [Bacteroidales bacterium]
IPLKALTDAGKYFLEKQQRSLGVDEAELIKIAVKSMGLDELKPFNPHEKIIEYKLAADAGHKKLVDFTVAGFAHETASESPAPGGGSVSAYLGALGTSLATMVANLSSHKRGWDDRWKFFSDWAEKGQKLKDQLLFMVDEDTNAFNKIMDAFGLPKKSEADKQARKAAIEAASKYAIEVPLKVMEFSLSSMELIEAMAEQGNPNSVSDAGVGAICAKAAVNGAFLNVKINAAGIEDRNFATQMVDKGARLMEQAVESEKRILEKVEAIIQKQA